MYTFPSDGIWVDAQITGNIHVGDANSPTIAITGDPPIAQFVGPARGKGGEWGAADIISDEKWK